MRVVLIDTEFARRRVDAPRLLPGLAMRCVLQRMGFLGDRDPLGDLLVPLQRRQLGTVKVFADLPQAGVLHRHVNDVGKDIDWGKDIVSDSNFPTMSEADEPTLRAILSSIGVPKKVVVGDADRANFCCLEDGGGRIVLYYDVGWPL